MLADFRPESGAVKVLDSWGIVKAVDASGE